MNVQIATAPTIEPIISNTRARKRKRQSGVYQIRCKLTGKVYVGSAVWLAKRKRHHREALLAGTHYNKYLQRAWNKHGNDSFEYSVLEYCEKKSLTEREQHYLDMLKAANRKHGFNLQPKAYSNLGVVFGPEMRAKISAARKRKGGTLSILQIEELRERMKGNSFNLGIKHTLKSREKMKKARKGRTPAAGMRHTPEARKKMSEARRGKTLTREHREKISQAHRGKKQTTAHRRNLAVVQAKLDAGQCEKIRAEYIPGVVRMRDLAVVYKCSVQTICKVINRSGVAYR